MAPRKFAHVSAVIPDLKIYEALEFFENIALADSVKVVPVRHGGEKENGDLAPAPNSETILNDYLTEHARIVTKDVIPLGVKAGITRNAMYAAIKRMVDHKLIKRTDVGIYVAAARKGRPPATAASAKTKAPHKPKAKPNSGASAVDRLVALVAAKQNGSDKGVMLADLKAEMELDGYVPTGVGPALTSLVAKGRLVRIGKGEYRTPPEQAAAPHVSTM